MTDPSVPPVKINRHGFTITNPKALKAEISQGPPPPPQASKEEDESFTISGFRIKLGNKPPEPMDVSASYSQEQEDQTEKHDPYEECPYADGFY